MHRPPPNHKLRSLLKDSGLTNSALAREVNEAGREAGLSLYYSRSSVAHWLSGMRPRHPVPELVAEAFTRRLSRRVTVGETGLADERSEAPGPPPDEGAPAQLARLGEAAGPPEGLTATVYRLDALAVPDWQNCRRVRVDGPAEQPVRVGRPELDAAVRMCDLFSAADALRGGRHARPALGMYLATTVSPWLRAESTGRVRREIFVAAAKLTYLHAFMCFDEGLHGLAQRNYLTSAELSIEAGDPSGYAVALRALSVQARYLGHLNEAVDLAVSAVRSAAAGHTSPRLLAFLYGQLAVARAGVGDRRLALANLETAERNLESTDTDDVPIAAYHAGSLAHQHAAVAAHLGDRRTAIDALRESLRHRPSTERRSRAILLARLAELQMAGGNLDGACETWLRFLNDYQHISSKRADLALGTMHALVLPHQNHGAVKRLRHTAMNVSVRNCA